MRQKEKLEGSLFELMQDVHQSKRYNGENPLENHEDVAMMRDQIEAGWAGFLDVLSRVFSEQR